MIGIVRVRLCEQRVSRHDIGLALEAGLLFRVRQQGINTVPMPAPTYETNSNGQNGEGLKDRTVTVYTSDGETVIGEFLVVGAATQQKSLSSTDLPLD